MGDALPELIIDSFDNEQVWQEIELQNDPLISSLLTSVSRAVASKNLTFSAVQRKTKTQEVKEESDEEDVEDEEAGEGREGSESEDDDIGDLRFDQNDSDDDESEEEKEMKRILDKAIAANKNGSEEDDDEDDGEMLLSDDDEEPTGKKSGQVGILKSGAASRKKQTKSKTKSVVDDRFFKLSDMEAFLDQEDAKEGRRIRQEHGDDVSSSDDDEEEEIDMFANIPSEDEKVNAQLYHVSTSYEFEQL